MGTIFSTKLARKGRRMIARRKKKNGKTTRVARIDGDRGLREVNKKTARVGGSQRQNAKTGGRKKGDDP